MYLNQYDNTLPQIKGPLPGGGSAVIGALFGGKKGSLPFYGINQFGAERRPLNKFIIDRIVPPDADGQVVETEEYKSPADKGAKSVPGIGYVPSYYDLVGSSYTLNDHSLTSEQDATLVPLGGGKMPTVIQPSKTWVLGTHPIYNYQGDGDRGSTWYSTSQVEANLLYMDFHVRIRVKVPKGIVNETSDYTFGAAIP